MDGRMARVGVIPTRHLAVNQFTKSANQNYGSAQLALGKIYNEGHGVKTDIVEAYKWFKLAQLQGVSDAEKELATCRSAMSIEQIKTAEDEVKQLQK